MLKLSKKIKRKIVFVVARGGKMLVAKVDPRQIEVHHHSSKSWLVPAVRIMEKYITRTEAPRWHKMFSRIKVFWHSPGGRRANFISM